MSSYAAWLIWALALLLPGAARGEVFVDADRAAQLIASGAAVIDARGESDWRAGHLPRARSVSWLSLRDGLLRTGRLSDETAEVTAAFAAAGVRGDAPVVVYDAGRAGWGEAGRIFWTLEYLGHERVYLLDGGIDAWIASGRAAHSGGNTVTPGELTGSADGSLRATISQVEAGSSDPNIVLWDVRERREYDGETPYGEARGGHIPGAVHLWYADLTDASGVLRPEAALRAELEALGITPDRTIIPLCTGGVRSGFAYAVLRELGYPSVANYDGSMWEWAGDSERPLAQ